MKTRFSVVKTRFSELFRARVVESGGIGSGLGFDRSAWRQFAYPPTLSKLPPVYTKDS